MHTSRTQAPTFGKGGIKMSEINYMPGLPWPGFWCLDIQVAKGRVAKKDGGGYWIIINVTDRKANTPDYALGKTPYGPYAIIELGTTRKEAIETASELAAQDIQFTIDAHIGPWALQSSTQEDTFSPSISEIAATLGRKGGQSTSPAKVSASRSNGKKGGRKPKDKEGLASRLQKMLDE